MEHSVCIHRFPGIDISHTKARCLNDVILKYDGNRETWNRTFFNLIFTESLGLPHRLIYVLKRRMRSAALPLRW
jgi:hypothetical protein